MAAHVALIRRLHSAKPLPPLEVHLSARDIAIDLQNPPAACAHSSPILVHAKRASWARGELGRDAFASAVAMPENTFMQAYGGNAPWPQSRMSLLQVSDQLPWSRRTGTIGFYGSGAGYRKFLNYSQSGSWMERQASDRARLPGTDLHIHQDWNKAVGRAPYVSLASQCRHRYLLHLMGTWPAHSNKLKLILACGLVVVMPQADWYEFWYPLLQPFDTFVPSANLALWNGKDLPGVRRCLEQHDGAARRIAENARAFVLNVLTPDLPAKYMRALLVRIAALRALGSGRSDGR